MWICHTAAPPSIRKRGEKSSHVGRLTECCGGDTARREIRSCRVRDGWNGGFGADSSAESPAVGPANTHNHRSGIWVPSRSAFTRVFDALCADPAKLDESTISLLSCPRRRASSNPCRDDEGRSGAFHPVRRLLDRPLSRTMTGPCLRGDDCRQGDGATSPIPYHTRSASLRRPSFLRSLGSSSFLRSRIAFGVTSTSSSSAI
jgi:hypothetical protein